MVESKIDLEKMWNLQKEFNENGPLCSSHTSIPKNLRDWNNFFSLALIKEVGDALSHTDWKVHRGNYHQYIKTNHLMEFVDCFKYLMSLIQLNGFTLQEFEKAFYKKSRVVEQMYKQEKLINLKDSSTPIVGVDIDGVLADYYYDYPRFVEEFLGDSQMIDISGSEFPHSDVNKFFTGYDKEQLMKCKDAYRQSERKANMPVCEYAKEFLGELKARGYRIVLLTARPIDKYQMILANTIEWLEKNELPYDCVLWGEKKEERLIEEFGDTGMIKFFVDDIAKNANAIADLGIPCYLLNKKYNQEDMTKSDVIRVNSLLDIVMK